jgi:hypothetical protein
MCMLLTYILEYYIEGFLYMYTYRSILRVKIHTSLSACTVGIT